MTWSCNGRHAGVRRGDPTTTASSGDAATTQRLAPIAVDDTGVLAGKTDYRGFRRLSPQPRACVRMARLRPGDTSRTANWATTAPCPASVPVAVIHSGVLAGKTVVAISAGSFPQSRAVLGWHRGRLGIQQLRPVGQWQQGHSRVPVRVNPVGALAGKQVVAVAAGSYHSFALCSDGTRRGLGIQRRRGTRRRHDHQAAWFRWRST